MGLSFSSFISYLAIVSDDYAANQATFISKYNAFGNYNSKLNVY